MTDAPGGTSTRRSLPRLLVTFTLALSGASAFAYATFLPLYPFTDQPAPMAWLAFGALELAAAVGVYFGRPWGRVLGVGTVVVGVLLTVARVIATVSGVSPAVELFGFLTGFTLDVLVLWWLLFRWRPRA